MKRAGVMTAVGVLLFVATIFVLLALQGRLDYAGTRGIPLVQSLFSKPSSATDASRTARPRALPPAPAAEPALDAAKQQQFEARVEALTDPGRQPQTGLFQLPLLESGLSAADLDEMARAAREQRESLARREAALDHREEQLAAREDDVTRRHGEVQSLMRDVVDARQQLMEERRELGRLYTFIDESEESRYREQARFLAGQDRVQAGGVVREMWRSESGRTDAVRMLRLMQAEDRDEILAVLSAAELRDIVARLANAVIVPAGDKQ